MVLEDKYAHLRDGKVFHKTLLHAVMCGTPVPYVAEKLGVCSATVVRYIQGHSRPMVPLQAVMIPMLEAMGKQEWRDMYQHLADA